jgi:hypothetical protein
VADIVAKVGGLGWCNFSGAVQVPLENMWGSARPTAHATRDFPSRVGETGERRLLVTPALTSIFDAPNFSTLNTIADPASPSVGHLPKPA